ncbi:hypothetical protein D9758_018087 [Tetrapyrgos nigripes]|uniref:Uncharacterized protein n=1 Tax=Tetrapyrgos nigripes TaxID=182062 RepID=A0A8H5BBU9_9AGAR|nr:hypothetical protein D9758_018087 [Tetrapyrgos nigripes]
MYCLNGTIPRQDKQNNNLLIVPMFKMKEDRWKHHFDQCDQFQPAPDDFLKLSPLDYALSARLTLVQPSLDLASSTPSTSSHTAQPTENLPSNSASTALSPLFSYDGKQGGTFPDLCKTGYETGYETTIPSGNVLRLSKSQTGQLVLKERVYVPGLAAANPTRRYSPTNAASPEHPAMHLSLQPSLLRGVKDPWATSTPRMGILAPTEMEP